VQGFYRGRRSAYSARTELRARLDSIAKAGAAGLPLEHSFELTRLLVHSIVDNNPNDLKRAATWARLMLSPPLGSSYKAPALFQHLAAPTATRWQTIIRKLAHILLLQAVVRPKSVATLFPPRCAMM
jgi:hypothetical protein